MNESLLVGSICQLVSVLTQDNQRRQKGNDKDVENRILEDLRRLVSNAEAKQLAILLTIQRLWRFCFVENNGGRICFEGRSQTKEMSVGIRTTRRRHLTEHRHM